MVEEFHLILQKIDTIYTSIGPDIQDFKIKDPQDIDYTNFYDDLKKIFEFVVKNGNYLLTSNKKVRLLFFAFSIEVLNCDRYHSSFWKTLYSELNTDNSIYTPCFNSLRITLEENGINIKPNPDSKRLVIFTLKGKAIRDDKTLELIYTIFLDYYKFHREQSIEDYYYTYSQTIDYLPFFSKKKYVIEYIDHATTLFSKLIEEFNDDIDDENFVRTFFNENGLSLGPFRHKKITSIIRILSNRMTPMEFQKAIKEHINHDIITPENNQIPVRLFLKTTIDYGIYSVAARPYQITPNHRIGLNEMVQWGCDNIVDYKGMTYFKKNAPFSVKNKDVRRLIFKGNLYYVWCGNLSIGNGIRIDGILYRSEGFAWDPKLKMTYGSEEEPPTITIETGNVTYYNKKDVGKRLQIFLDADIIGGDVTDLEGFSTCHSFYTISQNKNEFLLRAKLEGEDIRNKQVFLVDHILFSNSTCELIKGQKDNLHTVSKRYGESKYTLFSKYDPELIKTHMQISDGHIFTNNHSFLDYYIYEIRWTGENEFKLKIDSFSWNFQIKKELHLYFNNQVNKFSDFGEFDLTIDVTTLGGVNPTYQLFDNNYRAFSDPTELDQSLFTNGIYHLTGVEIIENTLGYNPIPGEYFIEIAYGDLTKGAQFFVIPKIDFHWPTVLPEFQTILLEFTTAEPSFSDVRNGNASNVFLVNIAGKVSDIIFEEAFSIILEKKEISIPLAIPKITYRIEIPEIPVFGYRLFERYSLTSDEHSKFVPVQELNYYDLFKSTLLLFSRPGEMLSIILNDEKIIAPEMNLDGYELISDLSQLKKYCTDYISTFSIFTSDRFQKQFKVFWNPRVFEITANLKWVDDLKLHVSINCDGPVNSQIKVRISSQHDEIYHFIIDCSGQRCMSERIIDLSTFTTSMSFNIQTFCHSFNSEWVPSKFASVKNKYAHNITILSGDRFTRQEKFPYHVFVDKIRSEQVIDPQNVPVVIKPIRIKIFTESSNLEIIKDLLDIYLEKSKSLHFFGSVKI
jgi:hypothetical protein